MVKSTKSKLTRNELLVVASQARAWLTALLRSENRPMKEGEIYVLLKEKLDVIGFSKTQLHSQLVRGVKNKLLTASLEDGHNLYSINSTDYSGSDIKNTYDLASRKVLRSGLKLDQKPDVEFRIVKNTGAVQMLVGGMLIQISVV